MNWQTVESANGQNVQMTGTITEICGEGVNENSGKPWKKVKVTDGSKLHNVTLRGDTLPGPDALNKPSSFTLATYQGTYQGKQYIGYSGFWNGVAQGTPQVTPQGQSILHGSMQLAHGNKVDKKEPDWDLKDFRIILQCCSKPFMEAQVNGKMTFDEAWVNAQTWANSIWIAKLPSVQQGWQPEPQGEAPYGGSQDDDSIPF